jgi:peptidoglycan/LPS O-acetylase OafA/YrhL
LGLAIYPWPALVNRFTQFIGKISYSIYLFHFFVLEFVAKVVHLIPGRIITGRLFGLTLVYLATLAISIPLCSITWRLIEKPGIRLGKRWIAHRESRSKLSRHGIPAGA